MTTATASPTLVCPPWCVRHESDPDPETGWMVHYGPAFGDVLRASRGADDDGPTELLGIDIPDATAFHDPSELRQLSADALAAAEWLEDNADGVPLAHPVSEPLVHFWACTSEGRPFLSLILCDAAAQRPNDGSRMKSSWEGVTCPRCLAAGPEAAEAITGLPDAALLALGAWPAPAVGGEASA